MTERIIRKEIRRPKFNKGNNYESPHAKGMAFRMNNDERGRHCMMEMNHSMDIYPHKQHAFQKVLDGQLHVYFALPGADKSKINLRTKEDTMHLDSVIKEEMQEVMGEREISLQIKLIEQINPDTVSARYADGILMVHADLQYPAKDVQIE